MLVSLKWLREYLETPPGVLDDADALAHRLTMASAEVEAIHRVGGWDRELVTIGEVLAVGPHPNADRLRLATVDHGRGEPQQVVCGAPNLEVGQRIAFAREGAVLRDGHSGGTAQLKRSKIRGVESAGMVLSERELGLSDEHEGILVLPSDAPVGQALADYLGDVVLDVHIWPNRADTMNMVGIAREIAAIVGGMLRPPSEEYVEGGAPASELVSVRIGAPELSSRYIASVVEGVRIGESPEWMQERLRAAGQRPINNVVDITNYVMLELGQPLHAFDLDRVEGGEIVVRRAREGERLTTLDGVERELQPDMLLITDAGGDRPVALAGVMGGASSEVTASTTRVLLEAAAFDASSIRRTSTRLHLRSESSSRFERGLSPELAEHASRRATKLLVEVAGGTARAGRVDRYPRPFAPAPVLVTRQRLDMLLGLQVPDLEVRGILETLGFEVETLVAAAEPESGPAAEPAEVDLGQLLVSMNPSRVPAAAEAPRATGADFVVTPPWWRTDVTIPDDVIEEVVRIAGYDRLPATTLAGRVPPREPRPLEELRDRLRDGLVAAGMQETITYSLTTDEMLQRVLPREELAIIRPLRLRNTLSSDREVLRPTMRHAVLETVERNLRAGAESVAVFEAARAFLPRHNVSEVDALPEERELITGAVTGVELDRWGRPGERALDLYDAKGMLEAALALVGVTLDWAAAREDEAYALLPGRVARLEAGGERVGLAGEVHPQTLAAFGIEQPVVVFELDLPSLLSHVPERVQARAVSRFPAVEQDLALVVDEGVPAEALRAAVASSELVADTRVFDVYRGEQLGAGKKSVALAIRYQASDRTLTTADANREQERIMRRLQGQFGAEVRG